MTQPPCPLCKTNKHVAQHGREEFFCAKCKARFDPSEDGPSHNDPVRAAESKEAFQNRQRGRR